MKAAPFPKDEEERVEALNRYQILDTLPEQDFDDLSLLASKICNTPIALISLVDPDRQWFKSKVGLGATETPREIAFCAHAILQKDVFIVPDSSKDERFHDNPLATGEPHVRFYAGAPLETKDGHRIGTLCVIDHIPRNLGPDQTDALEALARQVVSQLELRLRNTILEESQAETETLKNRLSLAVRSSGIGVWEWNIVENSLHWDDQMYILYGIPKEHFSSAYETWLQGVHPEDRERGHQEIQDALAGKKEFNTQFRVVGLDGNVRNIRASGMLQRDKNNNPIKMIGVNWDITSEKERELELQRANEEAKVAAQTKATFLANMSHEIRTPLNGILGMATLLSDEKLSSEGQRHLRIMRTNGDTLLALINDILDFSKIEAGKLQLENVSFDLEETISEITSLFYPEANHKDVKIDIQVDLNLPKYISTDVTRLRQILTNLIGNALKFTDHGSITVKATHISKESEQHLIQCQVIDTGSGMPEKSIKTLFKSFSQVDASTTRKFGGTGLGLAICKGICEAMGGEIGVESTLGEGSSFSFTFRADEAQSPVGANLRSSRVFDSSLAEKFPYRVLVADDHSTNQLMARKFLEKLGYTPDIVANGIEVLHSLKNKNYDLIFMDAQMPELDGYETTRRIRDLSSKKNSPWIIALTASATVEDQKRCISSGMNDFVSKPFTISDMANAIFKTQNISHLKETPSPSRLVGPSYKFDSGPVLKHFAGDEDILREVIQNFIKALPKLIQEIKIAIDNKNARSLQIAAHTLKGCVSNFFVESLYHDLHSLELMAKNERLAAADEVFKKVSLELRHLEISLSSLFKEKKVA